jgi:predicted ATPase
MTEMLPITNQQYRANRGTRKDYPDPIDEQTQAQFQQNWLAFNRKDRAKAAAMRAKAKKFQAQFEKKQDRNEDAF